jgi:hypothetical protein
MIKLLTVTWSYEDNFDIKDSFLYKSFIQQNEEGNLAHIHYNRNSYIELEKEFRERFGYQYEYILYKIFLTKEKLQEILCDYIIFADANDVVCLENIQSITPPDNFILFSSEANQWPPSRGDWGGIDYSEDAYKNLEYLNAGIFISSKQNYLMLLNNVISNVLSKNLKSFGGDQGIFTHHYLTKSIPEIRIDTQFSLFLSTFSRNHENFINKKFPLFVHDNGWNYGSPRFIEKFNLLV